MTRKQKSVLGVGGDELNGHDLYSLLEINKELLQKSPETLKKAYYKTCLKLHPDRRCTSASTQQEIEAANAEFQAASRAYLILSNERWKKRYDQSGYVPTDEELQGDISIGDNNEEGDLSWPDYFNALYEKISFEMLDKRKAEYQGSEEEKKDLLALYAQHEGDFDKIQEDLLFYTFTDEPRYKDILLTGIQNGVISETPGWKKSSHAKEVNKRQRKGKKEELEAEKHAKRLGIDTRHGDSLHALIASKKSKHDTFLSHLTEKYGKGEKKKKNKGPSADLLSDDGFEAFQKSLFSNKK